MTMLDLNFVCKDVKARQEAVQKAYENIIIEIVELFKTFPKRHLRTHFSVPSDINSHQFISACINISLCKNFQLISLAKNFDCVWEIGFPAYSELSRIIYKNTMREATQVFIEDCLEEHLYDFQRIVEANQDPDAEIIVEKQLKNPN